MKISTQPIEDHQVRLTVELEPELIEGAQRRVARELSARMKIPGFRPGKASYEVVQKFLGVEEIRKEAIYKIVDEKYTDILEEAKIEPYRSGILENVEDDGSKPITLTFKVPLKAEVTLGDYRSIRLDYEKKDITEEDIKKELDDMREDNAIIETASRPAQEGDLLHIEVSGRRSNPKEGEDPALINERNAPVVIEKADTSNKDEWPYNGFSRQLIGMAAGEKKHLTYTYPEDTPFEALRNVEAEFDVAVDRVSTRSLPEADDEFARSTGDYSTIDDLKKNLSEKLEKEAREEADRKYDDQIIAGIIDSAEIKYPPQMVEDELENTLEQFKSRLNDAGMSLETYLKMRNMELDALKADLRTGVVEKIRRSLVLFQVAEKEGIEAEGDKLIDKANELAGVLSGRLSQNEKRKMDRKEIADRILGNLIIESVTEKVWERLRSIAKGEFEEKLENSEQQS